MLPFYLLGLVLVVGALSRNIGWRWGALGVGLLIGVGVIDYAQRWPYL